MLADDHAMSANPPAKFAKAKFAQAKFAKAKFAEAKFAKAKRVKAKCARAKFAQAKSAKTKSAKAGFAEAKCAEAKLLKIDLLKLHLLKLDARARAPAAAARARPTHQECSQNGFAGARPLVARNCCHYRRRRQGRKAATRISETEIARAPRLCHKLFRNGGASIALVFPRNFLGAINATPILFLSRAAGELARSS
jgi:hypothetical protein